MNWKQSPRLKCPLTKPYSSQTKAQDSYGIPSIQNGWLAVMCFYVNGQVEVFLANQFGTNSWLAAQKSSFKVSMKIESHIL